jgi:rhodanese-related sulfurtransferase
MSTPNEVTAAEVEALMAGDDPPQLIDVREAPELQMDGWIKGARHMPMSAFQGREGEIDKTRPVVIHCAHGQRSWDVGCYLISLGFENVSNMEGGIAAWGGPIERSAGGR